MAKDKMTVEKFVEELRSCVDKNGAPSKKKMLLLILTHAKFFVENQPLLQAEVNRLIEIERLSLIDDNVENH